MSSKKEWPIIKRIAAQVAQTPGRTGAELSKSLGMPTAYRRLSEIRKLGLVAKRGSKVCEVSGKTAATWYPDDRPAEPDRGELTPHQERQRLQSRIDFLVNENAQLREKLRQFEHLQP